MEVHPERAPHFGGLWEAAVKSMKFHLKHVVANTKFTFEEFTTILTQVEACLNSRPLTPMSCDSDVVEGLTPGHFLIGKSMESLPDTPLSYRALPLLRRWHLCQSVIRNFWQRWSAEYVASLRRLTKWQHPTRNIGDVVLLQEDNLIPTKWPLARVVHVHVGKDKLVRVATVKTITGIYKTTYHQDGFSPAFARVNIINEHYWSFVIVSISCLLKDHLVLAGCMLCHAFRIIQYFIVRKIRVG